MKKIYIAFMTVAALAAVSCNTKEEYGSLPSGEVMFTAVQADNPESKTILQSDGSVFWSAGDSINLFYGTAGSAKLISNNSEPAQQTTFSGSLGGYNHNGSDYFHAVYPYSAENTFDGTAFTVTLPEVQSSVAGSFADDLFISMARSQDYTLQFYNLCGGVKFSVAEAGIKYVTFRGNNNEPLAGKVNVIFNDDGKPVVQTVVDGKTELRLDAPDGGTFEPGEWYYMVSLPATLSAGYTMTFYKDEKFAERITDSSITIKRAVWGRLTNADSTGSESTTGTDNGYEWVDLGLPSGLKWASCNVGANAPEEYGDYFAWGEIEPYYESLSPLVWKDDKSAGYYWSSYKWCNGSENTQTKYCTLGFCGTVDNKSILEIEDDAAHVNWGGIWRMPTDEEWKELIEECTWTWASQNGVNGGLVTGPNGNSIFLPAAGYRFNTYCNAIGGGGHYWSSTLYKGDSGYAGFVDFGRDVFSSFFVYERLIERYDGFSIRPVSDEGARVSVTGISLNRDALELKAGGTVTLSATVTPTNATQPAVIWSSSNTSVATVDYTGVVTAVSGGTVTIIATTYDGGHVATCSFTVFGPTSGILDGYEGIDLGLPSGLKWAAYNVGASVPEEYGDYFAWGETEPYYTDGHSQDDPCSNWKANKTGYNWASYKWCNGSYYTQTKYCTKRNYGTVDKKTVLDPEDDAAHVNWGESWRMPTDAEWTELRTNCTWTSTTQNGVRGRLVTGPNGNSIFLPAAGYRYDASLNDTGSGGNYWSSSLDSDEPYSAWIVDIYRNDVSVSRLGYNRYYGFSVRPVSAEGARVSVTGISLNRDALELKAGGTVTLSATVTPANATQTAVIWSSSNTSVATVNFEGEVEAVSEGTAIITAITYDGGFSAICSVTVTGPTSGTHNGYEWTDLGLPSGLKWAAYNVGATAPDEYGDYYAWGETEPYYTAGHSQDSPCSSWRSRTNPAITGYNWVSYKWCNGSYDTQIKYCTSSSYGTVDNKTVLDPEDDAAHVNWGGSWRMPTDAEWTELRTNCTWTWTTQNGVRGRLVTGPNGNSIFLPAVGIRDNTNLLYIGSLGYYWSSSLRTDYTCDAWQVIFDSVGERGGNENRYYGFSVRPVSDEGVRVSVTGILLDRDELELKVGTKATLSSTVTPTNATQPAVIWSSSNISVATVNDTGVVTSVSEGTAIITAITYDGGFSAICSVTVSGSTSGTLNGYEWTDLGLPSGLKWAAYNVGATAPDEYGDYYAWGETEPYYTAGHSQDSPCSSWRSRTNPAITGYNWASYKWCKGSASTLTKYNTSRSFGIVDNGTILNPEDDAAYVNWGGSWRMPTDAEWTELRTNCTWTWTTQNGVKGCLVTGSNGNSIFLPAAGSRGYVDLNSAGSYGYYRSSSLSSDSPYFAWIVSFYSDDVLRDYYPRFGGQSVRPVSDEGVRVSVTGISLNRDALLLETDVTATLSATVTPTNATQPAVIWSSSNTSVAKVDYIGVVTSVSEGTATITATTYEGGFIATCSVTVTGPTSGTLNGNEWVDMGLSSGLKWATCNVGATAPEEYGDYFAWGATKPYYESQDPLVWKAGKEEGYTWSNCPFRTSGDSYDTVLFSKYNTSSSYGTIDNKTVLETGDDASHVNWGGTWRMPTNAEWRELKDECTWTWTTQNGVRGSLVTGPNGNSIFLPAAGFREYTGRYNSGSRGTGYYWSSSLYTDYPYRAWFVNFDISYVGRSNDSRNYGRSVRPVTD